MCIMVFRFIIIIAVVIIFSYREMGNPMAMKWFYQTKIKTRALATQKTHIWI